MIKSCGLLWSWGDMKRPQTLITRYRPGKHRPTSGGPPAAGSMITIWGPASVLVTPDRPEAMITTRACTPAPQDRQRSCDTCPTLGGVSASGAHPATMNRSPLHW